VPTDPATPDQILAEIQRLYNQLRALPVAQKSRKFGGRGETSADEDLVAQIRALSDRYVRLTDEAG
jgi:hypothetical protein